ncbi:hypothetical protein HS088_TW04G00266 [Tripterygium wilfordii]|uniref:Uncharacterized protein n=1 Tax=Tripterygium wilfordii TaxID=458696 RepID=A0A7J7DQ33_TRIWF|nr:uncharacterized protein LOC119997511 [Tripterygium wilfordii]KAF5748314.1 hypothetical protein HS088_TW04G00266 [Tripterygium wilfordii]
MADKPSRALVLYGDGLARFIDPSHAHLHSLASKAACGFLSLPSASPSECEDERIVREFALLLDASVYFNTGEKRMSTVSERFMGMRVAVITDNQLLKSFGAKIGLSVLELKELAENNNAVDVSSELMKLLGFQGGKAMETSQFDLVFMHMGAGEKANYGKGKDFVNDVKDMDALVDNIIHMAQPGSEIGARLHLSVVMSYGSVAEANYLDFSVMGSASGNADLAALFPRQSYTMNGEKPRTDVRNYCPMLIAQRQDAVTRKDMVEAFSFNDFKQHGGNLVIPTDRFMHEIAFKLWKAPKYGA